MLDTLERMFKNPLPNKFSILMGEQIKKAREEKGLSQSELADLMSRRRATISDMENGKSMPSFETLFYLAIHLKKPLIYFVPPRYQHILKEQEASTVSEKEILIQFRRLSKEGQQIALRQIAAMADVEYEYEDDTYLDDENDEQ